MIAAPSGMTDDALLHALAQDNRVAFQELSTRYLQKICRLAYRVVGNRQDAEDVAQEVFVTVWNRRREWKPGEASFSTWIYRVATNRSIDVQRKRKTGGGSVELSDELVDYGDVSADEIVFTRETQKLVMGCLKQLPEKQMLALLYFYYEDMEISEICTRLGASEDSVRSLLKRGKTGMREILAARLGGDERKIAAIAPFLVG
jgi:RNA polymerase sigma-70 factor (ECF subfamily)